MKKRDGCRKQFAVWVALMFYLCDIFYRGQNTRKSNKKLVLHANIKSGWTGTSFKRIFTCRNAHNSTSSSAAPHGGLLGPLTHLERLLQKFARVVTTHTLRTGSMPLKKNLPLDLFAL